MKKMKNVIIPSKVISVFILVALAGECDVGKTFIW